MLQSRTSYLTHWVLGVGTSPGSVLSIFLFLMELNYIIISNSKFTWPHVLFAKEYNISIRISNHAWSCNSNDTLSMTSSYGRRNTAFTSLTYFLHKENQIPSLLCITTLRNCYIPKRIHQIHGTAFRPTVDLASQIQILSSEMPTNLERTSIYLALKIRLQPKNLLHLFENSFGLDYRSPVYDLELGNPLHLPSVWRLVLGAPALWPAKFCESCGIQLS